MLADRRLPASGLLDRAITAIVYDDSPEFDRFVWSTIGQLRAGGYRPAGVAQINVARPDRRRCDMIVEELSSGNRLQISHDRGNMARGCRLDLGALAALIIAVEKSLLGAVDFLFVNKFGKEEVEGRGFRDAIALALEREIPVVVGVPSRNREAWREFCGADSPAISTEVWRAATREIVTTSANAWRQELTNRTFIRNFDC